MKFAPFLRLGVACAASTLVTACASPSASLTPSAVTSIGASGPHADRHTGSWMAKGLKQRDLLYVSNGNGTVSVYRYWQRTLVGVLTKFTQPMAGCSDTAGNVYIPDYQAKKIVEYAHGNAKPLRTIDDAPYTPYGCAVSPTTGDLAVANYGQRQYSYYGSGNVAVYVRASGNPVFYGSSDDNHFMSVAYDDHGDLLALTDSGYSGHWYYYPYFYYLPKKSAKLILMNLPGPSRSWYWDYAVNVAFDGKYWVVNSRDLYLYSINVQAQYIREVGLSSTYGGLGAVAFYRKSLKGEATQIIGPSDQYGGKSAIDFWKYPAGGGPIDTVTQDLDEPTGAAISMGTPGGAQ